jgi:hypothetical protein
LTFFKVKTSPSAFLKVQVKIQSSLAERATTSCSGTGIEPRLVDPQQQRGFVASVPSNCPPLVARLVHQPAIQHLHAKLPVPA